MEVYLFFGIKDLNDNGLNSIAFEGLCIIISIMEIFYENIFVTITIDGCNKLLLVKRARICCYLKNRES